MASLTNLTVDMIELSYIELMLIWNSNVDGARVCVRIILLIVYLSEYFFWFIWSSACLSYDNIVITQWVSTFLSHGPSLKKNIRWATLQCWHLVNN